MNKRLFILSIFLVMIAVGHGQSYTYFPFPDSSFWRVDAWAEDIWTGCQENYYYNYYFGGDTIINSSSHKKIFRSPVLIIRQGGGTPCYVWPWATFTGYMGALRDDSLSNKSFFVFPDQINDTLLFDYNLAVGDTIKGYIAENCIMTITSVDSALIGTQYRKKWNFTTCNEGPGYIIQGIGSDNGLFEWLNTSGYSLTNLICVQDSSMELFDSGFPSAIGCQLVTSIEDISIASSNANFYPNPFSTYVAIHTDNIFKNATLIVFNSYGQKVKQLDNLSGQTILFNRENLKSGLYFFRFIEAKKIIATEKLLITDK